MDELESENYFLDKENKELIKKYKTIADLFNEKTEQVRLVKLDRFQTRLFTCAITIMNFIFSISIIYWSTQ